MYGVNPGPPGLGPGIPTAFPPDGLGACAQMGVEKASTAATATPFTRSFMVMDLAPVVEQVGKDAEGTVSGAQQHAMQFRQIACAGHSTTGMALKINSGAQR